MNISAKSWLNIRMSISYNGEYRRGWYHRSSHKVVSFPRWDHYLNATNDNQIIMPAPLTWVEQEDFSLIETDGKTVHLLKKSKFWQLCSTWGEGPCSIQRKNYEVLLLHATSPKNVYPILFEGLDTKIQQGYLKISFKTRKLYLIGYYHTNGSTI